MFATRRQFILGSLTASLVNLWPFGKQAKGKVFARPLNPKAFDPYRMYLLCAEQAVQYVDVELKNGYKYRFKESIGVVFDSEKPEHKIIDRLLFRPFPNDQQNLPAGVKVLFLYRDNTLQNEDLCIIKMKEIESIKIFRSPSSWYVIHPGW